VKNFRKHSSYLLLAFEFHEVEQQQGAADDNGAVRLIEGRPLMAADVEKQKISHGARVDAVEDVTQRATEKSEPEHGCLAIEIALRHNMPASTTSATNENPMSSTGAPLGCRVSE